jgi:peptidoglycan/xylan/chitin deacetylase (PgdA/CDA1 family)
MILEKYPRLKATIKSFVGFVSGYRVRYYLPPETNQRYLFTFDDGPLPNTSNILTLLDAFGLKATFFLVGAQMRRYPDIVAEVAARGHAIASHGIRHVVMRNLPLKEFRHQVQESFATIRSMTDSPATMFRPPKGQINPFQALWLLSQGYCLVFWSHQLAPNSQSLFEISPSVRGLKPIILLHDYDRIDIIENTIHQVIFNKFMFS